MSLALPGTEYVQATIPSNPADYEEHFNATETADKWKPNIITGIPIIGDIFSAFQFLFVNFQYLIDGFPMFLTWISDTYIIDASAQTAFFVITNCLRAIYAILMSIMVIEFIGGRYLTD